MLAGLSPLDRLTTGGLLGEAAGIGGLAQGNMTGTAPAADVGASFADALSSAAGRTVETLQNADAIAVRALQGEVPTREVVDAIMSAEQALQTSIAIRDKIVSAYLEISRMAI
jgi:flagellar hook-basal body complex protein FliE